MMHRVLLTAAAAMMIGCAGGQTEDRDFRTSGSREADQRAEQRHDHPAADRVVALDQIGAAVSNLLGERSHLRSA